MYGWDSDNLSWVRMGVNAEGHQRMVMVAEDINNPGNYVEVQGQYNSNGNFELLTAGSGSTTPTTTGDNVVFMDGSNYVWQDGNNTIFQ